MKYVGFFDTPENEKERRGYALPAAAKMGYISEVLRDLGEEVTIVSPSQTLSRDSYPASERSIAPGIRLKLFATMGRHKKPSRVLSVLFTRTQLLLYLLTKTKKDEVVLAYHSLAIQEILLVARAIRRFKLILEVEEVYSDVVEPPGWKRFLERTLLKHADAYVFSTEALDDLLNQGQKPYAIVYGDYRRPERRVSRGTKIVRVVYAGTLDPRKGGAAAAAAAAHLDEDFEVHILGFGTEQDVARMRQLAAETSGRGQARLHFHEAKSGREYTDFLHGSHIGLAPQDPDAKFNDSSFPSKILSYMAHGLTVVSSRVGAVQRTPFGDSLVYYGVQDGSGIAQAVRVAAARGTDDQADALAEVDSRFRAQLANMLAQLGVSLPSQPE